MNARKLLIPAVMLTAGLGASAKPAPVPALTPTPSDTALAEAQRALVPAVMGVRAPDSYPIPQRLQDYTDSKTELFARPCTGSRCGSISGSGSGWDDSDQ